MARHSKWEARATQRRQENAIKLIVVGAAMALAPLFLGSTPFGKAFTPLSPVGLVFIGIGALMLWAGRQPEARPAQQTAGASMADDSPRPMRRRRSEAEPVDRTAAELDRLLASKRETAGAAPARPEAWSKAVFDIIEWRRFEALIEALFAQAGFETRSQSHGADGGVDVWLYSRNQPGDPVSIVQCKHWHSRTVGVKEIRELRGVMAAHGVKRGQFAATSTFTPDAKAFAKDNGITLHDVDGLLALIGRRSPEQQRALLDVALEGEYWRPTCASCGIKLVERPSRKGSAFWGCVNYPRGCRTKLQMRTA